MALATRMRDVPVTREIAPGVRLHLLRTDRFTTSYCRVAFHRDLGAEATATAVLAQVLQSATAKHPSRKALADRLGDLYGASLHVGVSKLGDRQLFVGSLDWPTAHVPRARGVLVQGLRLLREVICEPKRGPAGGLAPEIVATEIANHRHALRSQRDDKGRHALRGCLQTLCADEPYGLEVQGREEDLASVTPEGLAALHGRLLARAPVEVFLVGDLGLREATAVVRKHLLWPGREARPARVPPAASVRSARARPRHLVEHEAITQGKVVLGSRGRIRADSTASVAAETLAGVLGGGSYGRLFKVVREEHGLCYYASASWHRPKGILLVQIGVDPAQEARARRMIARLTKEVGGGQLDPAAHDAFLRAVEHAVAAMQDSPRSIVAWYQQRLALGGAGTPAAVLAALRRVTPAQVRAVGSRIALDTTFALRPEEA